MMVLSRGFSLVGKDLPVKKFIRSARWRGVGVYGGLVRQGGNGLHLYLHVDCENGMILRSKIRKMD